MAKEMLKVMKSVIVGRSMGSVRENGTSRFGWMVIGFNLKLHPPCRKQPPGPSKRRNRCRVFEETYLLV